MPTKPRDQRRDPSPFKRRVVLPAAMFVVLAGAALYLLLVQRDTDADRPGSLIAGPPPIAFEPVTFDFGEMRRNTVRTETVRLQNAGSTPLQVQSARTNCSCIRAELPPVVLEPGSGVAMPIRLDSQSRPGAGAYTVRVFVAGYEEPALLSVSRVTLGE